MNRMPLGRTGMMAPPLCVGCWNFGGGAYWGEQPKKASEDIVRAAMEAGANLFDTAAMYNEGASEEVLGQALKGIRDKALISTKFGPHQAYPKTIREALEGSLKRLRTDYVDIYMLHWPINKVSLRHFSGDLGILEDPPQIALALDTLDGLRREGKIRAIGISNFGPGQMKEALSFGVPIAVNELPYNIFSRAIERDILPLCIRQEVGVFCSMPLQQGVLSGRYRAAAQVPPNQAHSRHFKAERGQGTSRHGGPGAEEEMFCALPQLEALAQELHITMTQLSLSWLLHRRGVTSVLAGCRDEKQFRENFCALKVHLPAEAIQRIDALSEPVLKALGYQADYYENAENCRVY